MVAFKERSPPQLAWPPHLHVLCMHSDLDVCPSFVNFFMFSLARALQREQGERGVAAGWQLPPFAAENATESLLRVCFVLAAPFSSGFLRPNCCEISWPVYYTCRLQLQLKQQQQQLPLVEMLLLPSNVACCPIVALQLANVNGKWFG